MSTPSGAARWPREPGAKAGPPVGGVLDRAGVARQAASQDLGGEKCRDLPWMATRGLITVGSRSNTPKGLICPGGWPSSAPAPSAPRWHRP
jgi:hypothetical protein